jgi:hypothetical protein
LKVRTVGMEYNDQKDLLDQIHAAQGDATLVPAFHAVQRKEGGQAASYTYWPEGTTALLPETDGIMLLKIGAGGDQAEVAASGAWQRVRDVVGDLMQPLGMYPERWRVADFPTLEQLAAIGKEDWPP